MSRAFLTKTMFAAHLGVTYNAFAITQSNDGHDNNDDNGKISDEASADKQVIPDTTIEGLTNEDYQCYRKTIKFSDLLPRNKNASDPTSADDDKEITLYTEDGQNLSDTHKELREMAKGYLEKNYETIFTLTDPEETDDGNGGWDNRGWDNRFLKRSPLTGPKNHPARFTVRVGYVKLNDDQGKQDKSLNENGIRFYENQRVALTLPMPASTSCCVGASTNNDDPLTWETLQDKDVTFTFERSDDDGSWWKKGVWISSGFTTAIMGGWLMAILIAFSTGSDAFDHIHITFLMPFLILLFFSALRCQLCHRMTIQKKKIQETSKLGFCMGGGFCIMCGAAIRDTCIGDERARSKEGFWCWYPLGILCGCVLPLTLIVMILLSVGNDADQQEHLALITGKQA